MAATTSASRMTLSIDAQDEDVQIAAAALKDMRESNPSIDAQRSAVTSITSSGQQRSYASPSSVHFSQPATPSLLSIASSATSNSFDTSQNLLPDRSTTPSSGYSQSPPNSLPPPSELSPSESQAAAAPQDDYLRRLPFFNTALKSYDYAKSNSRVVKFGAEMVESSVKTISKPVMNRLPGAVTNRLGYTRTDSDKEDKDRDREATSAEAAAAAERGRAEFRKLVGDRTGSWRDAISPFSGRSSESQSRASSTRRVGPEEDRMDVERNGPLSPPTERDTVSSSAAGSNGSDNQRQLVGRSTWHSVLVEAGGISAAVSEESMRKMRYCLQCLQYATANLDNQIRILQAFIASVDSTVTGEPVPANAMVSPEALRQYMEVKKNVVSTIRQVVDVVGKYAGGALPEPAKATVKNLILALPGRWSSAVRDAGVGLGEEWTEDDSHAAASSTSVSGSRSNPRKRGHGKLNESTASIASKVSAGSSSASLASGAPAFGGNGLVPLTTMQNGTSAENNTTTANGRGANRKQLLPPTAGAARTAAHRVLTLATESLHAVRGVTGVFKETLDRAETWLDRFRYVGYRSSDPTANLPPISTSMTLPPIYPTSTSPLDVRRGPRDIHLEALAKSIPSVGPYGPYGSTPPISPVLSPASELPGTGGSRSASGRDSFPFDNPAPGWVSRSGSVPAGLNTTNTRSGTVRRSGSVLSLLQSPTGEGSLPPPSTPGSLAGERDESVIDEEEEASDEGLEHRARKRRKLRPTEADGRGDEAPA